MGFTDGNDGDNEVLDLMVVLEGGCLVSQCGLCLVSNRDTVLRFSVESDVKDDCFLFVSLPVERCNVNST